MPDVNSIVDQVHPSASGVNIILSDTVQILFDREMDESRLADNIFITGPDYDTHTGPDHQIWLDFPSMNDEEEILQTPGYHGLVDGSFTFERISPDSDTAVSGIDVTGSGLLYRTRAVFTPTYRLAPETKYSVYVSGDESSSDDLDTGISTRTVYDPIANAGNTSSFDPTFSGGYTGTVADTYTVEITATGTVGVATFKYWSTNHSTPSSDLLTRRAGTLLRNGVNVAFDEHTWYKGDKWTVVVKPRDTFTGNLYWSFLTGSGSIQAVPEEASTSILGDTIPVTTTASGTFRVDTINPADESSHQEIPEGEFTITATFSHDIDATTITSGVSAVVTASPVDGDSDTNPASGVLIAEPVVDGSTLDIVVASGQLRRNNLVEITLDSGITGTSGNSLSSDFSSWFTTTYYPYYCTLQKVRLEVGAYIPGVVDDTINFAIQQASVAADALTWSTSASSSYYKFVRSQYTCCRAQEILLLNAMQNADKLKSKSLGDLSVTYNPSDNDALDRALACMDKWEGQLRAGGQQKGNAQPKMVVKGSLDPDRPPIGRRWGYTESGLDIPVANTRYRGSNSRRHKSTFYRPYKGKKRYDR